MSIETPAKIAVLGAGPIGLEAALYARYLGYDVEIFERGQAAENVLRWGHVRMFSPFHMNRSPLGLAALTAQDSASPSRAANRALLIRVFGALAIATTSLPSATVREMGDDAVSESYRGLEMRYGA